jgi:hypothetical protein
LMSEEIKGALVVLGIMLALLGAVAILADCSRDVARISAQASVVCTQAGGTWMDAMTPDRRGRCLPAEQQKGTEQ